MPSTFTPRQSTLGVVVIDPYSGLSLLRQSGPKEAIPMNKDLSVLGSSSLDRKDLMKPLISYSDWTGFS
jgi:hypothetical protein